MFSTVHYILGTDSCAVHYNKYPKLCVIQGAGFYASQQCLHPDFKLNFLYFSVYGAADPPLDLHVKCGIFLRALPQHHKGSLMASQMAFLLCKVQQHLTDFHGDGRLFLFLFFFRYFKSSFTA